MAAGKRRWSIDQRDGTLTATTGVVGRAARLGHRLTIGFPSWRITVSLVGAEPAAVELRVDVGALEVLGGEGGVTPLSAPERALARANALTVLDPGSHPQIVYTAEGAAPSPDGYVLSGGLTINGVTCPRRIDVVVGSDGPRTTFAVSTTVKHSEHDLKPHSLMMGSLKVADEVRVGFFAAARVPR